MAQEHTHQISPSSREYHEKACSVFPGGVSHNVRADDPYPIYIDRTDGPFVYDVDGNRYVDFWNDHGYYFNRGSMGTVSYAITGDHIDGLLEASREVVREMRKDGYLDET